VQWETAVELGAAGYFLERATVSGWERVNEELLPACLLCGVGAVYELIDAGAVPGGTYRYRLLEQDWSGRLTVHGPYTVTVGGEEAGYGAWSAAMGVAGADADPDADGLSNGEEYLAGTDPLDAGSVLRVLAAVPDADGGLVLSWPSEAGRTYVVEVATNLAAGFEPAVVGIAATPPLNRVTLPVPERGAVFYRVIAAPRD